MRVHTFAEGISPKLNVITQLEFELSYYNVTIQDVIHNTESTPPQFLLVEDLDRRLECVPN